MRNNDAADSSSRLDNIPGAEMEKSVLFMTTNSEIMVAIWMAEHWITPKATKVPSNVVGTTIVNSVVWWPIVIAINGTLMKVRQGNVLLVQVASLFANKI